MVSSSPACWFLETEDTTEGIGVRFPGDKVYLDESNTDLVGEQLFRLIEDSGRSRLVLDFGNVTFLTSTTLGVLVLLHKKLKTVGGGLTLCKVLPHIYEVFTITHLNRVLNIRTGE